jgi:apolipoprotein N-acyltransferase
MTGFPWLLLSHTQYDFSAFAQIADVTGAYGLSGIIVVLNALLFSALIMRRRAPAVAAAGLFCLVCLYGYIRIHTVKIEPLLKVAMVQASVPQELKELLSGKYDPTAALERYIDVSRSVPASEKIDMIVWPETVLLFPYTLNVEPGVFKKTYAADARFAQDSLKALARKYQAYVLAGATSYLPAAYGYVSDPRIALQIPSGAWNKRYNSAYFLDPEGVYKDRYDKIHLVPFGEYLPLPNLFPIFSKLVPFTEFLLPGDKQTIFDIKGREREGRFGVLICYEDMDPELARGLRLRGADFFVNLSNDAWFATSIELDQHFAVARFRAIENRVGILRSGNNGITGIIDPLGRIQAVFEKETGGRTLTKDVTGYLIGNVSTSHTISLYTRVGDMLVLAVSGLVLIWFGLASWKSRRESHS